MQIFKKYPHDTILSLRPINIYLVFLNYYKIYMLCEINMLIQLP
jgi:hypothetical protein